MDHPSYSGPELAAAEWWGAIASDPRFAVMMRLVRRQSNTKKIPQDSPHANHTAYGFNLGVEKVIEVLESPPEISQAAEETMAAHLPQDTDWHQTGDPDLSREFPDDNSKN